MESKSDIDPLFSHVVYSRNVIEFTTVANEFCAFTESLADISRKDFLGKMQKLFPLLYLKASLLPDQGEENEDELPEKFVSEADYAFIRNKLSAKLGELDSYPEVFEPGTRLGEEAIEANISENIADIYQDLKDFVLAYRIGSLEAMQAALRECKNNFELYWGQQLVNGLRAIHQLLYGDSSLDEEKQGKSVW